MDSRGYLQSYGWKEGEAFKSGGLRKPILLKHKKDTKGLGHDADQAEAWWERVFDGQLKSLDVSLSGSNEVNFKQNEIKVTGISKSASPLYRMFVQGEGLQGTIGSKSSTFQKSIKPEILIANTEESKGPDGINFVDDNLMIFNLTDDESDSDTKRIKKAKRSKSKNGTKGKKDKNDKIKKEKNKKKYDKTESIRIIDSNDKSITKDKINKKNKTDKKDKKEKKDKKDKKEKIQNSDKPDNIVYENKESRKEKKEKKEAKKKRKQDTDDTSSKKKKKL